MQQIFHGLHKSSMVISFLIYSILIITICFSQHSSAQDLERSDGSTVVVPMNGDVLWDQSDNHSNTDIVSQDFIDGGPFIIFDARAADDFLVPDGLVWKVEAVKVFGTFDGNARDSLESLDVDFYKDVGGLPGQLVPTCVFDNILPVDVGDPSFLINLPTPCILTPGT